MAAERKSGATERIVDEYFSQIRDLRRGVQGSPEKLRDLWDEDGVFEFVGAPPVTGSFAGRNAIYVLYKNRFTANRMPLRLEGREGQRELIEARLGEVDTEVRRTKVLDGKVVAAWTTTVATEDSQGFQVAGSHTFTFRGDRISHLKVVVSPRAEEAANLRLESLSVDDIGRLALAAWAVV